ncbi:MAG: plasmid mobilization relaxosome protein MobC [Clostridia bacterium]|nr:plasmid mobilization relaxosome protein MobC [Clostridia bacterium]
MALNRRIKFALSDEEYELIQRNMAQCGITNTSAYLRKMAIDGYCLKLDTTEIKELISLFRRISNNFNQIAKVANSNGRIYADDIKDMKESIDRSWDGICLIVEKLSTL